MAISKTLAGNYQVVGTKQRFLGCYPTMQDAREALKSDNRTSKAIERLKYSDMPLGVKQLKNRFRANRNKVYLGTFDTIEEAVFAYQNNIKKRTNKKRIKSLKTEKLPKERLSTSFLQSLLNYSAL